MWGGAAIGPFNVQLFAELLAKNRQLGLVAHATAIVLPHTVEGAALMAPLYQNCFVDSTRIPPLFEELDAAVAWVQGELGTASST